MVNEFAFDAAARVPDPARLVPRLPPGRRRRSTCCARSPRAASPISRQVHAWNLEYVASSPEGRTLRERSPGDRPRRCASWPRAASISRPSSSCTRSTSTRRTMRSCSATRRRSPGATASPATGTTARPTCSGSASARVALDGAHVEFLSGVGNPIGSEARPDAPPPPRCSASATGSTRGASRDGSCSTAAWAPTTSTSALPSAAPRGQRCRATRSCGRATRCTGTRSSTPAVTRPRRFDDVMRELARLLRRVRSCGRVARRRARRDDRVRT